MIDAKRLAKIRELCNNAQFGYAVVNNQVYYKDVTELLTEREELLVVAAKGMISEEVVHNIERLTQLTAELQQKTEEDRITIDRQNSQIHELLEADKKAQHKMKNLMQYNETLKQLVEVLNGKKPTLDEKTLESVRAMSGTVGEDQ